MKNNEIQKVDSQSSSFYLDSDEPVFIVNKKGELVDVNDVFCKKIGFNKKDIVGTAFQESVFLTQDSRKQMMYRQIAKLIGRQTPFYSLDIKTKKGAVLAFDVETKLFSKDGEIVGEIGIVRSINDNKTTDQKESDIPTKKKPRKPLKPPSPQIPEIPRDRTVSDEDNRRVQAELKRKQKQIESLEQEIDEIKGDLRNSQREIDEERYNVESLKTNLEKSQKEIEKQHKIVIKKDAELRRLKAELEGQKEELKLGEENLKLKNDELEKTRRKLIQNQSDLEEKDYALKNLQAEL
jgi:PAS domain S-box-containing protein